MIIFLVFIPKKLRHVFIGINGGDFLDTTKEELMGYGMKGGTDDGDETRKVR